MTGGRMLGASLGAAVLVLWCGVQEVRTARGNLWVIHAAVTGGVRDSVADDARRFAALRRDLPANRPVAYFTDYARSTVNDHFQTALVRAQWALAPMLVLDSDTLSPVVADFHGPVPDSAGLAALGLRLLHDYGQGVLLLAREGR